MSPKMSQMVKNMLYWPFGTIWDPFGPHRGIGKPAMLGHFWSQMGHFWTPGTLYRCLEMAKKVYSSIVLCMRKVLVRSVLVLCINVVIAPKKVTEKVKKWEKIATLWLFLSHRGCHMAPRLQKHEYLLATKFWSDFEHFRMSGSIITWELFLSLTSCFRSCSFFDTLRQLLFKKLEIEIKLSLQHYSITACTSLCL